MQRLELWSVDAPNKVPIRAGADLSLKGHIPYRMMAQNV